MQKYECFWCNAQLTTETKTRDHLLSRYLRCKYKNIQTTVVSCSDCNSSRGLISNSFSMLRCYLTNDWDNYKDDKPKNVVHVILKFDSHNKVDLFRNKILTIEDDEIKKICIMEIDDLVKFKDDSNKLIKWFNENLSKGVFLQSPYFYEMMYIMENVYFEETKLGFGGPTVKLGDTVWSSLYADGFPRKIKKIFTDNVGLERLIIGDRGDMEPSTAFLYATRDDWVKARIEKLQDKIEDLQKEINTLEGIN